MINKQEIRWLLDLFASNIIYERNGIMTRTKIKRAATIVAAAVMTLFTLTACSLADSTDYVQTVKNFAMVIGLPDVTWGDVTNKFLDSPTWTDNEKDGFHYVNVKGNVKGYDDKVLSVAIKCSEDPADDEMTRIDLYYVRFDDDDVPNAEAFVIELFNAYNDGYETVYDYVERTSD